MEPRTAKVGCEHSHAWGTFPDVDACVRCGVVKHEVTGEDGRCSTCGAVDEAGPHDVPIDEAGLIRLVGMHVNKIREMSDALAKSRFGIAALQEARRRSEDLLTRCRDRLTDAESTHPVPEDDELIVSLNHALEGRFRLLPPMDQLRMRAAACLQTLSSAGLFDLFDAPRELREHAVELVCGAIDLNDAERNHLVATLASEINGLKRQLSNAKALAHDTVRAERQETEPEPEEQNDE